MKECANEDLEIQRMRQIALRMQKVLKRPNCVIQSPLLEMIL